MDKPLDPNEAVKLAKEEAKADVELLFNPDLNVLLRTDICLFKDKSVADIVAQFGEDQLRLPMDQMLGHIFMKALSKDIRFSDDLDTKWV